MHRTAKWSGQFRRSEKWQIACVGLSRIEPASTLKETLIYIYIYIYPWSFKNASILVNRFRVLKATNRTSFELATGHPYRGKLALFGESVLFKRPVRNKGNAVFEKGIWVTKHPWNDNHVLNGSEIFTAKGLPWCYTQHKGF